MQNVNTDVKTTIVRPRGFTKIVKMDIYHFLHY